MKKQVLPQQIAMMLQALLPDPIGKCVVAVNEIAGIAPIPDEQRYGFTRFHDYFTNPQPDWVTELRANEHSLKWYLRLADGIFSNVQGARRAVQYHLDRIIEIENEVAEYLSHHDFSGIPKGSCHAIGNTQKLDVEYHALVFAYRRTLEYFAAGIAAYFKSDCNSFKDLPNVLTRPKNPQIITAPILQLVNEHKTRFDFVLSIENSHRSVRDTISHYEFVSAGTFNLTYDGFRLIGGGENLNFNGTPKRLCDVLNERAGFLDTFLNETLVAFTNSLHAHHSPSEATSD
jgi:hypothetical protein